MSEEVCDELCEMMTDMKLKSHQIFLDTNLDPPLLWYSFVSDGEYSHKDIFFFFSYRPAPFPDGIYIVGRWCYTPFTEAKETLDSFP